MASFFMGKASVSSVRRLPRVAFHSSLDTVRSSRILGRRFRRHGETSKPWPLHFDSLVLYDGLPCQNNPHTCPKPASGFLFARPSDSWLPWLLLRPRQ